MLVMYEPYFFYCNEMDVERILERQSEAIRAEIDDFEAHVERVSKFQDDSAGSLQTYPHLPNTLHHVIYLSRQPS